MMPSCMKHEAWKILLLIEIIFCHRIPFPSYKKKLICEGNLLLVLCHTKSGISRLSYQILWTLDLPNHRYFGILSIKFHKYPLKQDLPALVMEQNSVVCTGLCCLNCISRQQLLGSWHAATKNYCLFWHSAKLSVVYFEMLVRKVHLSFKYPLGSLGSWYLGNMDSLVRNE